MAVRRVRRGAAASGAALGVAALLAPAAEAALFPVNTDADAQDGDCFDEDCTLREAVYGGNALDGPDTITFAASVTGTIAIDTASFGHLPIEEALSIQGPGADVLEISGGVDESRIFYVNPTVSGAAGEPVMISGLTLTDGLPVGDGGAVRALYTDLTIADSVLTENEAQRGGAVFADQSSLTVLNSSVTNNRASSSSGGGVSLGETSALVESSTVSGNVADEAGGGIHAFESQVTVVSSTIASNEAGSGFSGGGIYRSDQNSDVSLSSTIVADNVAPDGDLGAPNNAAGSFEVGFSLIEDTGSGTIAESTAGSNVFGLDPQLAPLAANAGATRTHLPAETSPAVDAGVADGLGADQRGLARTVDQLSVANAPESDGTDIGAVELGPIPATAAAPQVFGPCRGEKAEKTDGTAGGDEIVGTGDPDLISGLAGKDNLSGIGAADCIRGDEGNDFIRGGGGGDRLRGGQGKDRVRGQNAKDRLAGQAGKDDLNGGGGRDRLSGGGGGDRLKGGPGKDKLKGGGGNDKLIATSEELDKVNCGGGRDKARVDLEDRVSKSCERVVEAE